jgi:hypothetical protein
VSFLLSTSSYEQHTVWQLAICTLVLGGLDLAAGLLVFAGGLCDLRCAIGVSHSGPRAEWPGHWRGGHARGSCAGVESSPDLEASLSLAAMIAEKIGRGMGGQSYHSGKKCCTGKERV